MMNCAELINRIAAPLVDELVTVNSVITEHCQRALEKGMTLSNSTSNEDCLLLYALIRHFGSRHVFEVGTYIGTTAIAMNEAVKRNGGLCTTCDPVAYNTLPPWSGVRFINSESATALQILCDEARSIDFVFLDWVPDQPTLDLIPKVCNTDAIVGVHDYVATDPKGAAAVAAVKGSAFGERLGQWFVPDEQPVDLGSGIRLNLTTAFFVPSHLLPH
jgi:hypothetical protein